MAAGEPELEAFVAADAITLVVEMPEGMGKLFTKQLMGTPLKGKKPHSERVTSELKINVCERQGGNSQRKDLRKLIDSFITADTGVTRDPA